MVYRTQPPVGSAWEQVALQSAEQTLATSRFVRNAGIALSTLLLGVAALAWFVSPDAYWGRAFCGAVSAGVLLILPRSLSTIMLNSAHQLMVSVRYVRIAEGQAAKGTTLGESLLPQWFQRG